MSHHYADLETRVARLEHAVRELRETIEHRRRCERVFWVPVCGWLPVRYW